MSITIVNGVLAKAKGKELPLVVCHKPTLGYFVGTRIEEEKRIFTRESEEIWDTFSEASQALETNTWSQSLACGLFESE